MVSEEKGNASVHYKWILGVLMFLLMVAVTLLIFAKTCCQNRLMEYLAFASTLLSIVLSVFAIQFTFFSNHEMHHQFLNINGAVAKIEESSRKCDEVNTLLSAHIDEILQKLDSVNRNQEIMCEKISFNTNVSSTNDKNKIEYVTESSKAPLQNGPDNAIPRET